jgi:hypothetical protein
MALSFGQLLGQKEGRPGRLIVSFRMLRPGLALTIERPSLAGRVSTLHLRPSRASHPGLLRQKWGDDDAERPTVKPTE